MFRKPLKHSQQNGEVFQCEVQIIAVLGGQVLRGDPTILQRNGLTQKLVDVQEHLDELFEERAHDLLRLSWYELRDLREQLDIAIEVDLQFSLSIVVHVLGVEFFELSGAESVLQFDQHLLGELGRGESEFRFEILLVRLVLAEPLISVVVDQIAVYVQVLVAVVVLVDVQQTQPNLDELRILIVPLWLERQTEELLEEGEKETVVATVDDLVTNEAAHRVEELVQVLGVQRL